MSDESVSEVEANKPVTSEDASFLSKSHQKSTRAWLKPLLLGAGLGIAIAFGGIVFTLSSADIVRSQKVELGDPANNDKVEIKSGLQLGDRVVVDGAGYLKDGDKVRVAS